MRKRFEVWYSVGVTKVINNVHCDTSVLINVVCLVGFEFLSVRVLSGLNRWRIRNALLSQIVWLHVHEIIAFYG